MAAFPSSVSIALHTDTPPHHTPSPSPHCRMLSSVVVRKLSANPSIQFPSKWWGKMSFLYKPIRRPVLPHFSPVTTLLSHVCPANPFYVRCLELAVPGLTRRNPTPNANSAAEDGIPLREARKGSGTLRSCRGPIRCQISAAGYRGWLDHQRCDCQWPVTPRMAVFLPVRRPPHQSLQPGTQCLCRPRAHRPGRGHQGFDLQGRHHRWRSPPRASGSYRNCSRQQLRPGLQKDGQNLHLLPMLGSGYGRGFLREAMVCPGAGL